MNAIDITTGGARKPEEVAVKRGQASETRGKRRTGTAEQDASLRDLLLDAATRRFGASGYAAVSLREIAEDLGCTKPAMYHYFRSKEDLFLSALERETLRSAEMIQAHVQVPAPMRDSMKAGLRMFLQDVREAPHRIAFLLRAEMRAGTGQPDFDFAAHRSVHLELIESMFREAITRGEVRASVSPKDAAIAVLGIIRFRIQLWLEGCPLPADLPELVVDTFFDGVAP